MWLLLQLTAAAISCNKSHICRLCPFLGRICTFLLETDSLGELWEALAFFLGSFGPFYGEQIDCGNLWPFLWEQINCGKLALFMVRFKYYMLRLVLQNGILCTIEHTVLLDHFCH